MSVDDPKVKVKDFIEWAKMIEQQLDDFNKRLVALENRDKHND